MRPVYAWLFCCTILVGTLTGCSGRFFSDAEKTISGTIHSLTGESTRPSDAGEGIVTTDSQITASSEDDAFSLFGFPVEATEGLSGFAYEQLMEETQSVYSQLYTGISDRKSKFTLRASDAEVIKTALTAILVDHPEFFWISGNAGISGFKTFGIWQIQLEFSTPSDQIDEVFERIEPCVEEYLASLPEGAGEYEKVKRAYEYIIDTTDYSAESLQNQNIRSVFLDHQSVCAGYARALQYLLQRAGVWCTYLEGKAEGDIDSHAWNMVRIDGVYTYVDPSWGDPTYGEDATDANQLPIIYDYLCLTTDEMRRSGHGEGATFWYPECTDQSYDYYRLNGMYYEGFSAEAASRALWHAVDEAERSVFFKYSDDESYTLAKEALFPEDPDTESLLAAPIRQRMEWDMAESMNYYYSCSDALRIIKIYW